MACRELAKVFTYVDWFMREVLRRRLPPCLYDFGAGCCHVLMQASMVWGWTTAGCELTSRMQAAVETTKLVARRLAEARLPHVMQRAHVPRVDELPVCEDNAKALEERLVQLRASVLFAFWAGWAEKDKRVVLRLFRDLPDAQMLVVGDFTTNFGKPVQDCMYAQELLVHNDVAFNAFMQPKMAGSGSTKFRLAVFTKVDRSPRSPSI